MTIQEEIDSLKALLADATDTETRFELIKKILDNYVSMRSTDCSLYVDMLLQLSDQLGNMTYRAWALFYQSIMGRYKGEYGRALILIAEAEELFTQQQDKTGISSCLNNMGLIYRQQGNYADALKCHLKALKLREETGDANGTAMSYGNIGMIYYWLGDYKGALDNNMRALAIMEQLDKKRGIANALTNVGHSYYAQHQYAEALEYHLRSQQIEQESGNESGVSITQGNIGIVYRSMGRHDIALPNFLASLAISEKLGNKHNIASLHGEIGTTYYELGKYAEAMAAYKEALKIGGEIGVKEEMRAAYEGLTKVCRAQGHYAEALDYNDQYHAIEKEMSGQKAQRQIAQLNVQHDMELKEKEAQLLKEKNDAINVYAGKLEASNNALKQFAHVASHDLREPLRMVTSYLGLLEKTMGDDIGAMQKQFIGFAVDGATRMENLIHDLLRLAKVDADPKIEAVPLTVIVEEVKSNLEVLLREKNAQINSVPLPTIMADRTLVMQVFQNIIGNGIKYNESVSPTINIDCTIDNENIFLSISDNGIGIPKEYREKAFQIFQRVPTEKKYQGTGIGLAVCKKIVEGLGGTIAIEDNPNGGSIFQVTLPSAVIVRS